MSGTSEAGPSNPKRARFNQQQPRSDLAAGIENIDVERYALARGIEISAMERAIKASRDSGAQRAFQSLPRHLRRRAASHNIRRLPKRLRAKAKFEMLQDQAKVLKKRKFRQLPIAKRRKLLRSSRIEILHGRQREKAWLETHIWHAKRMKMKDIWMYRIAYTPIDKAFRPSYRASMHGVIVHDSSYMQTLEVRAYFDTLQEFLSLLCDASAVPPYSVRYSSGIRESHTHLYEVGRYPLGLIGPATVIWQESRKTADDDETEEVRGVFIRFHPSIMPAVADAVEKCIKRIATARGTRPPVASQNEDVALLGRFVKAIYRTFCSFEITGPMATDTIKACLKPVRHTSEDKLAAWRNLPPPAAVPSGTVLTFDVYDPRLSFPPHLAKSERSHTKSTFIKPSTTLSANENFWDEEYRGKLVAPRYSKIELDKRREQNLVPGTKLNPSEEDDSIPIMLIQRSIGPEYADKENKDRPSKNSMFGWTLIVPTGWGTAFWHSLAFADTRVGGLRERSQQFFEAGCPSFPEDFACTSAFKSEIEQKAKDMSARWMRTPPAKRVNYKKLQTTSPWKPAFSDIVQCLAKTIDTQQKTEAELAGPESATMEEDANWRAWMPWGNGTPPFELSGPIVSKILAAAVQHMQDCENMPRGALKTQDSLDGLIKSIRTRRTLPTPREDPEVITTFVKVRLEPVSRGSPKYNAMIYSLDDEEYAAFVQSSRRLQERAKGIARAVRASMPIGANAEANEEDELEENDEDDENEPIPAAERIVGYVTTGNMSLARGRGQGFGAVNLVHLANIIAKQSKANPDRKDKRPLVLFRNPASRTTRFAWLDLLE